MQFTDSHLVPCLSDEDPAAVALYMKCLGEKIDSDLQDRLVISRAFRHRPVSVWEATTATVSSPGTSSINATTFFRYNWPLATTAPRIPNIRGWWSVGANLHVTATGAVTADSRRILRLRVEHVAFSTSRYATFTDKEWESNSANGENLLAQGSFFFPGIDGAESIEGAVLRYACESGNASDLAVDPLLSHMWAYYLGDTPQIAAVV